MINYDYSLLTQYIEQSKKLYMSVPGTSSESQKFLKSLDERKLVDLCADLLALEEHREIKITEGPGEAVEAYLSCARPQTRRARLTREAVFANRSGVTASVPSRDPCRHQENFRQPRPLRVGPKRMRYASL